MEVHAIEWQPNSIFEYIYCMRAIIIFTSLPRRDWFQTAAASLFLCSVFVFSVCVLCFLNR